MKSVQLLIGDSLKTFHTSENVLEDGSSTYDVFASDENGQELIAEPASKCVADGLADALNIVVKRFLDSGSDNEIYRLMVTLDRWAEQS